MKPFSKIAAVLLAVIAVIQLVRFFSGWTVTVNAVLIPVWVSGIACVVAGGVAAMVWREARR